MRRKPTYQELANATLAKTNLGAVTQPYVPYNDNALAVKELRTMTDRLALEARVNQGTQAQVFATAAETGLPPTVVQQMVNHAETQQRLFTGMEQQFQQVQSAQERANQQNTERVINAIEEATFTGNADKAMVIGIYKDYVVKIAQKLITTLAMATSEAKAPELPPMPLVNTLDAAASPLCLAYRRSHQHASAKQAGQHHHDEQPHITRHQHQ